MPYADPEVRRAHDRARSQQKSRRWPNNQRNYPCSHPGCNRPAFAKRLCNTHYIRKRNGKDMDKPIRDTRQRGKSCRVDGCSEKNYGRGLCRKHWCRWDRRNKTIKLVEMLGGVCVDCKQSYPPECFDFHHHEDNKAFTIGQEINSLPFAVLVEEARKCQLLCANCHRTRTVRSSGLALRV